MKWPYWSTLVYERARMYIGHALDMACFRRASGCQPQRLLDILDMPQTPHSTRAKRGAGYNRVASPTGERSSAASISATGGSKARLGHGGHGIISVSNSTRSKASARRTT